VPSVGLIAESGMSKKATLGLIVEFGMTRYAVPTSLVIYTTQYAAVIPYEQTPVNFIYKSIIRM